MPGGSPLVIVGSLKVGSSSGTATPVDSVVQSFRLSATRDIVEVPGTLTSTVVAPRLGWAHWQVEIVYYSNPDTTSAQYLTRQFLAALADTAASPPGSLYFEGTLNRGPVLPSNPKWSGRFMVAGVGYGGQVGEVSIDSQVFPMTAAPSEVTS